MIMILYSLGIILALAAYMYQQWNFIGGYGIGGKVTTNLNSTYDYIVVGAGSAGAGMASRLSENPEVIVLLLESNIGFSHFYSTTRNGIRSSTSRDILRNAMLRENLHVDVNSLVTKVSIENRKAIGIEVIKDNRKEKIRARNEVIVSAGGIGSPKLLMLSGIGPKEHLNDFNINLVADLPVGKNSDNHMHLPLWTNINISSSSIFDNEYLGYLRYLLFQTGMFASPIEEVMALFRADGVKDGKPDFQIVLLPSKLPGDMVTGNNRMSYIAEGPGLTFLLFHLNHKGPGEVKLQSSDPFDAPDIDPKHFSNENNMLELIEGVRFVEKLMKTVALKQVNVSMDINKIPMCEHEVFNSDVYWKCFISYVAFGAYINSGTCRMGAVSSPLTVVDSRLRVKGITGLRVADASVIPRIVSGGTNAATIMIAERAAEFIKRDRLMNK